MIAYSPTPTPTGANPWDNDPVVGAPQAPAPVQQRPQAGPIFVPGVKQRDPIQDERDRLAAEQARINIAKSQQPDLPTGYRMGPNGQAERIPGLPVESGAQGPKTEEMMAAARVEALDKLRLARRLRDRSKEGYFTGSGYQTLKGIPIIGQNAYDFEADTDTLKNAAALQRIMEMAQANGGKNPLTPLSNSDFQALASSLTSLDPRSSDDQYQRNLQVTEDLYRRMYEQAGGKDLDGDLAGHSNVEHRELDANGRPKMLADEQLKRGDEAAPIIGARVPPEIAGQVSQAIHANNREEVNRLYGALGLAGPSDANWEAVRKVAVQQPNHVFGTDASALDTAAQNAYDKKRYGEYLPVEMARIKAQGMEGQAGTALAGYGDTATFGFADEIGAAGDTLLSGGTFKDNLQRVRAGMEAGSRVNPGSRFAGQMAGALSPLGRVGTAIRSGGAVREGAILGGAYGVGSSDPSPEGTAATQIGQRATGGALGALIGGGTAGVLGAAVNRAGRPPTPPGGPRAADIARAADEEGIQISRPIVDPSRRDAMSYLESSIGGGGPVRRSLAATSEGLETRAGELGAGGTALDEFGAGSAVQGAARRFIQESGGRARRMYDRAAELAGDTPVRGQEALAALDNQIADLSRNANQNAPLIRYMQEVRGDFVDEAGNLINKGVGDIRDIRTGLRGNISNRGLTGTDADRRMGMVLDAATRDITRDLGAAAPRAVAEFRRADTFYRERQSEIKNVVQRVLGASRRQSDQISPETAWRNVRAMAGPKGDSAALARLWRRLEPGEARDAAASLAETFGRRSADEPFSPANFINSVRGISGPARQTLFGPEGARSIANLRLVAEAYRDTAARLNNSRSGQVMQWGNFLRNFVPSAGAGAAGGAVLGGPVGAAVGASLVAGSGVGVRNISARMLMSPNMSRWLAQAARQTTPRGIERQIERLRLVATRDPAIAQDALGLQQYLQRAIAETPSRAAATGRDENQ